VSGTGNLILVSVIIVVDSDGGGHSGGGHGGRDDGYTMVVTGVVTVMESPETMIGSWGLRDALCNWTGLARISPHWFPVVMWAGSLSDSHFPHQKDEINKSPW
jgi:hypothetical protein